MITSYPKDQWVSFHEVNMMGVFCICVNIHVDMFM